MISTPRTTTDRRVATTAMVTWELKVFGISVAPEVGVASVLVASSETASVYYIIEQRVCVFYGRKCFLYYIIKSHGFLKIFFKVWFKQDITVPWLCTSTHFPQKWILQFLYIGLINTRLITYLLALEVKWSHVYGTCIHQVNNRHICPVASPVHGNREWYHKCHKLISAIPKNTKTY